MKTLRQLFLGLIYLLPATLFFSYYPLIYLGRDATMNFELSLPLLWLPIFALTSLLIIVCGGVKGKGNIPWWRDVKRKIDKDASRQRRLFSRESGATARTSAPAPQRRALATRPEKRCRRCRLGVLLLFPLYATASTLWSPNPIRTLLTSGVLWLVIFAIFSIIFLLPRLDPPANFRRNCLRSLFLSTTLVCLFCWLQSLLDVAGCSRSATLLCPGCTAQTFGFPHPSGFAIEPQFMGNLLLAPTLTSLYLISSKKYPSHHASTPLAFFFSSTLFLTLSRGAIYAYALAFLVMLIFAFRNRANWHPLILIPLCSFIFTLSAQGIFSALGPTSDSFVSGTTKVVHQLSLGIIDIRPESVKTPSKTTATPQKPASNPTSDSPATSSDPAQPDPPASRFDGYIPASTNERLGLNSVALQTWRRDLPTILFGVGLGGAGRALSETAPENPLSAPNAIIQNQFLSLLLELGLIGVILLACSTCQFLALLFETIRSATSEEEAARARNDGTRERRVSTEQRQGIVLLSALSIAYLITLNFFSGLPNALQIYLLPPLLYVVFCRVDQSCVIGLWQKRKKSKKVRKNPCAPRK